MGLDYQYTCPIIDEKIDEIEEIVKGVLRDTIDQFAPMTPDDFTTEYINKTWSSYSDDITYYLEEVRDSNRAIREAADDQIEQAEEDVETLETRAEQAEQEVTALENRVDEALSENVESINRLQNLLDEAKEKVEELESRLSDNEISPRGTVIGGL